MRRDRQPPIKGAANPGKAKLPPSVVVPSPAGPIDEIGWGDSVLDTFRTRLFHGFREDFTDTAVWAAATRVMVHAIRTFGSEEKAYRWLTSKCGALDNRRPYDLLRTGRHATVDEELDRIDYGIYV